MRHPTSGVPPSSRHVFNASRLETGDDGDSVVGRIPMPIAAIPVSFLGELIGAMYEATVDLFGVGAPHGHQHWPGHPARGGGPAVRIVPPTVLGPHGPRRRFRSGLTIARSVTQAPDGTIVAAALRPDGFRVDVRLPALDVVP